ncbi:hypothetical protein AYL99_03701 [Fonsecaea erecta]|uniref:Uncharacterized protein n=1 Tax=Fonsecaea erecta TaxID=1367422 RepID=A0A178ZNV4_9EURO|nr:hypothetical protein AYL99_03701 [Fonsecaea erecta]OAP61498.1 hypothetical protein AYL99_03701 [Fonsecaea erecta]
MASSATVSPQPEPSLEQRLDLSLLLLAISRGIDLNAVSTAKWRDYEAWLMSLPEGEIPSESEINFNFRTDAFSHPDELTMDIVLGDALQYLQIRELGCLASRKVRGYSHEELVASLQRLLELSQPWPAKFPSVLGASPIAEDMDYVLFQHALKLAIAQLEQGVLPIEPLAMNNPFGDTWANYLDAALARERARNDRSLRSEDRGLLQNDKTAVSLPQIPPQATGFSTPIYVRRSPSAISAVFATTHSQTPSSGTSGCSITPSESVSQVRNDQTSTCRYLRRPGYISMVFDHSLQETAISPQPVRQQQGIEIEGSGMSQTVAAEQQEQEGMDVALGRVEAVIDQWLQEESGEPRTRQ